MGAKLIFVRRSEEEINIFGGEVFADVDGKNVASVKDETITVEVSAGAHSIKMYKSHGYGSMIGFAESDVTLAEGEVLVFKYSPPMVVTQPGHITVSDFSSYEKIERDVNSSAQVIAQEKRTNDEKVRVQEKKASRNIWGWIVLIFIIPAILWFIYEMVIWDTFF